MDILGGFLSAIAQPSGMWESIIFAFEGFVKNYALAIILLTLIIKIIWVPFDFFNRKVSRKQQKMQAVLQPQMEILQKKYGSDKQILNQKVNELYKKNNYNIWGSCVYMLVFMVLNIVIFFTLFGGLNSVSSYKIAIQYEDLKATYIESIYEEVNGVEYTEEIVITNEQLQALIEGASEEQKEVANLAVKNRYGEIKNSFLWIENVWKADSPFQSCIPSFSEYASTAKLNAEQKKSEEQVYTLIMTPLNDSLGRVNGYFILAILAAGTALLSAFLTNGKLNKKDNVKVQPTNKIMLIILPLLMGIFGIFYNSIFAIYMVTSQLVSIITAPLINLLVAKLEKRAENKQKDKVEVVDYRRK